MGSDMVEPSVAELWAEWHRLVATAPTEARKRALFEVRRALARKRVFVHRTPSGDVVLATVDRGPA